MDIKSKACGAYGTNCYIVKINDKEIIIDPGVNATAWVLGEVENPVAILNTHGHFDHVWSNHELAEKLNIPIYAPEGDCFMLENDPFLQGTPSSHADVCVRGDETFAIEGINVAFMHFPGHTPGCSVILIENALFSGDFIFKNSIGRYDFPYSDAEQMRISLEKFLTLEGNWEIYPGHGSPTTLQHEQKNVPHWLAVL
ncbi:MBL fold metallo-hydrolase [Sulfurospirillum barnesii]|uniref:Zn-dependent hydrolase, glyoxylase n=1 Tax=Sulfurospirillum barnesii (strain ATCC 700032 / DSM 10660 / SES-3) TaxID=760154 RepID=I3XXM4_SULBS|nr:MBL fold metallo-hydrolase [Sulfurospirillum barnesii]AFL68698.1 Zn-dependent hydrolase, glyoxylase [Sulfurospirillum barnesii SES-3]